MLWRLLVVPLFAVGVGGNAALSQHTAQVLQQVDVNKRAGSCLLCWVLPRHGDLVWDCSLEHRDGSIIGHCWRCCICFGSTAAATTTAETAAAEATAPAWLLPAVCTAVGVAALAAVAKAESHSEDRESRAVLGTGAFGQETLRKCMGLEEDLACGSKA